MGIIFNSIFFWLLYSAFFWLVSLLLSSLLWLVAASLSGPLEVGLVFAVLFQELFRYLIYLLLRKADAGLKKITDSSTQIINNKNILAYVSGLGFGIISGLFSFVNILASAVGPGTVGLQGDSTLFFVTQAVTTLIFILLHVVWGVLFFNGMDRKNYWAPAWVVGSHMLVSCLTLLNKSQLYAATIIPSLLVLILSSVWSASVSGATLSSLLLCVRSRPPLTVSVTID